MILILRVSLFQERKQFSKLLTIYISVCTCRFSVYSAFVEIQFMLFCCQSHASLFSLLFVCLLSHFCSSSESDSDSDKQKSGKKNKDKPKRYESAIFYLKKKIASLSPLQPFQVKHTATYYFAVNLSKL